jgi:hypothetical protein
MKRHHPIRIAALVLAALIGGAGHAAVVVIVSAKAGAPPALEVICQAYLGKTNLPAALNNLAGNSSLRDEFYSKACHKDPTQVRSIWSKLIFTGMATPPPELESDRDVKKMVAADPNRVGYIDNMNVDASVKIIATLN